MFTGNNRWSEEEKKILEENYGVKRKQEILQLLPDRSRQAIFLKAWKLGLTRHLRPKDQLIKPCMRCGKLFNSAGKPDRAYCSVKCLNSNHEGQSKAARIAREKDGIEKRRENGRKLAQWNRANLTPELRQKSVRSMSEP